MKKLFFLLAVCVSFPAPGSGAGTDCAKPSDACRSQPAAITPFMAKLKKSTREPAAPPKVSAPPPIHAAGSEPPVVKKTFSRPGWLAAAALFLYGLYYFLKEGKKRKGKR
jgi:hypothetical protein